MFLRTRLRVRGRRAVRRIGRDMLGRALYAAQEVVSTGMAELGVQPNVIEAVLNHRSGHKAGVAGVYNRAAYEQDVKRALALWADHLAAVVSVTPSKVIPMARAMRA